MLVRCYHAPECEESKNCIHGVPHEYLDQNWACSCETKLCPNYKERPVMCHELTWKDLPQLQKEEEYRLVWSIINSLDKFELQLSLHFFIDKLSEMEGNK